MYKSIRIKTYLSAKSEITYYAEQYIYILYNWNIITAMHPERSHTYSAIHACDYKSGLHASRRDSVWKSNTLNQQEK